MSEQLILEISWGFTPRPPSISMLCMMTDSHNVVASYQMKHNCNIQKLELCI